MAKMGEKEEEVTVEADKEVEVGVDSVTRKKQKCSFHQGDQAESDQGHTIGLKFLMISKDILSLIDI